MRRLLRAAGVTALAGLLTGGVAHARPLLLISIDGLRPGDVIEAEKRGLKVPNLRRFMTEGTHADAVVGVLPTLTYPSHTSLITGVSPAKHGVVSNFTFDPTNINQLGWYWYASDIKVPTLWDAAHKAGKTTGNVHWPVSVGARGIDYNLPQIWRTGHEDDDKLLAALATPDLLPGLTAKLGAYAHGIDESITGDENRARFVEAIIRDKKPYFMTAYFTALDHEQHEKGLDTPEAHAVLERIDAIIGKVVAAERAAQPDADIALVSDHGFAQTKHDINLYSAFIKAGLIQFDATGKVTGWDAAAWNSGGSLAIVLARPEDKALHDKVAKLLAELKANPDAQIEEIIEKPEIETRGGNPRADFYINFKLGAMAGGFKGVDAPVSAPSHYQGMHGYFPNTPELRATFMIMGPGIPAGKSLGVVDMRAIAPTLAKIMDVPLPTAEKPALLP
jgi:predicted AlkP superfamily pyrophosphatase or phosphodiesterase